MFDFTQLTVNDFTDNVSLIALFDQDVYRERGNHLLEELEIYNLVNRDVLVRVLNEKMNPTLDGQFPKAEFIWLQEKPSFRTTREAGLLWYEENSNGIVLFVPADIKQKHLNKCLLALLDKNVEVRWITPTNAKALDEGYNYSSNYELLFKALVLDAIHMGATDIHFKTYYEDGEKVSLIEFRHNNDLIPYTKYQLDTNTQTKLIASMIQGMTGALALDLITPEGVTTDIQDLFNDGKVDLRVTAEKASAGYYCVCRIQQSKTFNFTIESLGFSPDVQQVLHQLATKKSGLTLITGAMRTGKNTTAFAVANEIIKQPVNIISYESPIEVRMPFVQIAYNNSKVLENAIRLAKKQDVNVAYLNEIPDKAVAFAVQDLVNSSVHVMTTMHIDRLYQLPYKLREYYEGDWKNIISQINAVINQKMYTKLCPYCKKQVTSEIYKDTMFYSFLKERGVTSSSVSSGCPHCNGTGKDPNGLQPYVEYVYFTPALKSELLMYEYPYQMEAALQKEIEKLGVGLEEQLLKAIKLGELSADSLDTLF